MVESSLNKKKTLWEEEEIARYEQFLLFPQCFQKTCTTDTEKPGPFFGKGLNTKKELISGLRGEKRVMGLKF